MKEVKLPYGKEFIELEVDDNVDILVSQAGEFKAEKSEEDLVRDALLNPIGSEKLSDLVKGKEKITIITSDHTRPVPSHITMPILLEEIRSTNPEADITILIATGFHRPTTHEELVNKFGEEIVNNEKIIVHKSGVDEDMVELDRLPSGGRLLLNKHAINTDLLISEGFIEPHFFAGFRSLPDRHRFSDGTLQTVALFHLSAIAKRQKYTGFSSLAVCFVEPDDNSIAVFRLFYGIDNYIFHLYG